SIRRAFDPGAGPGSRHLIPPGGPRVPPPGPPPAAPYGAPPAHSARCRRAEASQPAKRFPQRPLDVEQPLRQRLVVAAGVALGQGRDAAAELVERGGDRRQLGVVRGHRRRSTRRSPRWHRPTIVTMLARLDLRGAGTDVRDRLPRPDLGGAAPVEAVREILAEVKKRGDAALREYTERFDGVR